MSKFQQYLTEKAREVNAGYVVKSGGRWYVDREDMDSGATICKPGDTVTFKKGKVKYTAIVGKSLGRDGDTYELEDVELNMAESNLSEMTETEMDEKSNACEKEFKLIAKPILRELASYYGEETTMSIVAEAIHGVKTITPTGK